MKTAIKILLLTTFLSVSFVNAETVNLQGLWKYYGNVFDGSQKRFDNIDISVEQGSELYFIEWIRIVNKDSLISSITANNSIPTFSFSRLDLNGEWEQINYGRIILPAGDNDDGAVRAVVGIDTCTIV